jgi:hypothetical protein
MTRYLALGEAARRVGMSRSALRESRRFTLVEHPGSGAEREDAIVAARRLVNLDRKVAADEKWLDTMTAKGASSLMLEQMRSRLAADKETLERLRAESRGQALPRPERGDDARRDRTCLPRLRHPLLQPA